MSPIRYNALVGRVRRTRRLGHRDDTSPRPISPHGAFRERALPRTSILAISRVVIMAAFALIVLPPFPSTRAQEIFEEKSDVIPEQVEKMYVKGLQYLQKSQGSNGSWTDPAGGDAYGNNPAVVGLAVLSMLAHGDDPNTGPYSETIRHGLDFILTNMDPSTGYIGNSMYNHGFSTLALAESYGVVNDPRIGPALKQAVACILTSQAGNPMGAWRYSPQSRDADTTVSGAQLVALFAARNAGMAVPEEAIQKALKFFIACQTPEGGFGYTGPNGPNAPRSAIGTLMLALSREKKTESFRRAVRYMGNPQLDNSYYHYYLYYASQALFQASYPAWQEWNGVNIKTLATAQEPDGSWNGQLGKTFSTATSLLSLALNYRFLPIYER